MQEIDFRTDILPLKNVLYRLALRITLNKEDAEDIVQETLIKVWNHKSKLCEVESIENYCIIICRNTAIDFIKKKKDNKNIDNYLFTTSDEAANPLQKVVENNNVKIINDIINTLPENQKLCIQLRDIEKKQYKEIAEILSINEQQVKTNIFRARQTIKNKFKEVNNYGL